MCPDRSLQIGILHYKTAATRNDPPHFAAAFRAVFDRRIVHGLAYFKSSAAGAAEIFIDRHIILSSSLNAHPEVVL
jgi:hypothetical protein